jgi:hypothetical protein
MKLKSLTLWLLGGLAVGRWYRRNGHPAATAGATSAAASLDETDLQPGGLDQANVGERLRDDDLTGSPVTSDSPLADTLASGGNLFNASPGDRADAKSTGLPDFARGA